MRQNNLRQLRRYFCLGQKELAYLLNTEQTYISKLENGKHTVGRILSLRFSTWLNISTEEFIYLLYYKKECNLIPLSDFGKNFINYLSHFDKQEKSCLVKKKLIPTSTKINGDL